MSMLSAQIDSLRSCADLYDGTTKPEMAKELQRPYLAQELREAADTIWQLRDDLQRANAENTKLRSELESVGTAAYLYGRGDLLAENAKLREQGERLFDKTLELATENDRLRELLDFALPIAMYAASTEEGDRMRELMREVEL